MKRLYEYGWKVYSQQGEDGIIDHIFGLIGATNKKIIEICAGNGKECNSANLIINHGYSGLLLEGSKIKVRNGIKFFKDKLGDIDKIPIHFVNTFITKDNIVDTIKSYPYFLGEIDLLSFDMDGVDYWILKEILEANIINPRFIILECHDIVPHNLSITVPYSDNFTGWNEYAWKGPNYSGASITAFINLLSNYHFVGTEKLGFNACFIRNDISHPELPKIENIEEYYKYISKRKKTLQQKRWDSVKDLEWVYL